MNQIFHILSRCLDNTTTAFELKFDQSVVGWALAQQYGIEIHGYS